jgi:hypothetical protein
VEGGLIVLGVVLVVVFGVGGAAVVLHFIAAVKSLGEAPTPVTAGAILGGVTGLVLALAGNRSDLSISSLLVAIMGGAAVGALGLMAAAVLIGGASHLIRTIVRGRRP